MTSQKINELYELSVSYEGGQYDEISENTHVCIIHSHQRPEGAKRLIESIGRNVIANNYLNPIEIIVLNDDSSNGYDSEYIKNLKQASDLINQLEVGNIRIFYAGEESISNIVKSSQLVKYLTEPNQKYLFSDWGSDKIGGFIGSQNLGSAIAYALAPNLENTIITHLDDDILVQYIADPNHEDGKLVLKNDRSFFHEKDSAFADVKTRLFGSERYNGMTGSYTTDLSLGLWAYQELFRDMLEVSKYKDISITISRLLNKNIPNFGVSYEQLCSEKDFFLDFVKGGFQPFIILFGKYLSHKIEEDNLIGGNVSLRARDISLIPHMTFSIPIPDMTYSNTFNLMFPGSTFGNQEITHLRNPRGRTITSESADYVTKDTYSNIKVLCDLLNKEFGTMASGLELMLSRKKENATKTLQTAETVLDFIRQLQIESGDWNLGSLKEYIQLTKKKLEEKIETTFSEPNQEDEIDVKNKYESWNLQRKHWPQILENIRKSKPKLVEIK